MKAIALLALLALAPLAQAGTPFAGRELTPAPEFISPSPAMPGVRVQLTAPPANPAGVFAGRDLTPAAAYINPSSGRIGTRVMPAASGGTDHGNNLVDYGADFVDE